jgi:hypothetical protein
MSMQSEGKDAKEGKDQQATRDGTGDSGSGSWEDRLRTRAINSPVSSPASRARCHPARPTTTSTTRAPFSASAESGGPSQGGRNPDSRGKPQRQALQTPYRVSSCDSSTKPSGASFCMSPGQACTSYTRSHERQWKWWW